MLQKDSIRLISPIQGTLPESEGLKIDQIKPVSEIPLLIREQTVEDADSSGKENKNVPTPAQLRYWWWQREQKLLIDNSRYIKSTESGRLVSATMKETEGFRLPSRVRSYMGTDWLTVILLLTLIFFASVRTSWQKYLSHLLGSLASYNTAHRLYVEKNYTLLHGATQLDIIFHLIFPLFIYQSVNFFGLEYRFSGFILYLATLILIAFIFLTKKILYRFTSAVVENVELSNEYLFNVNNYHRVLGLILIPIVAAVAFCPFTPVIFPLLIGFITILTFYILSIFRGFAIILKKQFSIFYLFLYFCTLELLPLVLLFKIFIA